MIRKRTIIIAITILLLLAGSLSYLQWGRQMDVPSSSGSGSDNHYELRVSVILNTLVVTDQQKCTEQIFEVSNRGAQITRKHTQKLPILG